MADDDHHSENLYANKWDKCLWDSLVKTGAGLGVGLLFSLIVFKRKSWPTFLGTGVGIGMGVASCQHEFEHRTEVFDLSTFSRAADTITEQTSKVTTTTEQH